MMSLLKRLARQNPLTTDLGLLVLRLWFGLTMAVAHGYGKLMNLGEFSAKVAKLGIPLPGVLGPAAGLSEFLGGILLAVGLATRVSAVTLTGTMTVAAFVVHGNDPFQRKELAFCYGFAALALLLAGPGRFSADARLLARK
ncbi:MAG: DoxX family protein [Myxococcales bacterium]|nr:DoxX family protein [Myxococcales bacterium]